MTAYDQGVDPAYRLTRRQRQILELEACGLAGKQIADRLGIKHQTVKNHMMAICRALGARNSMQALAIAIERELIDVCQEDAG